MDWDFRSRHGITNFRVRIGCLRRWFRFRPTWEDPEIRTEPHIRTWVRTPRRAKVPRPVSGLGRGRGGTVGFLAPRSVGFRSAAVADGACGRATRRRWDVLLRPLLRSSHLLLSLSVSFRVARSLWLCIRFYADEVAAFGRWQGKEMRLKLHNVRSSKRSGSELKNTLSSVRLEGDPGIRSLLSGFERLIQQVVFFSVFPLLMFRIRHCSWITLPPSSTISVFHVWLWLFFRCLLIPE